MPLTHSLFEAGCRLIGEYCSEHPQDTRGLWDAILAAPNTTEYERAQIVLFIPTRFEAQTSRRMFATSHNAYALSIGTRLIFIHRFSLSQSKSVELNQKTQNHFSRQPSIL